VSVADTVAWTGDDPRLNAVRGVLAGAGVGVAFLLAGAAAWLSWRAVRTGAHDRLLLFVALLVVLTVTARGTLAAAEYGSPVAPSLCRREVVAAGVCWAVVLGAVGRWRPLAALSLLGFAVVGWILTAAPRTGGRIDPAAGTITYGSRTFSTTGLTRVRGVSLGLATLFWLRFERGTVDTGAPRALVVPRSVAAPVRSALERAVDAPSDGATSSHSPGRTERAVAAALGVAFLLVGPVLWLLLPPNGDGTLVAVYLTFFSLPFAAVLLRYALVT